MRLKMRNREYHKRSFFDLTFFSLTSFSKWCDVIWFIHKHFIDIIVSSCTCGFYITWPHAWKLVFTMIPTSANSLTHIWWYACINNAAKSEFGFFKIFIHEKNLTKWIVFKCVTCLWHDSKWDICWATIENNIIHRFWWFSRERE